jgi:hypothetical protein
MRKEQGPTHSFFLVKFSLLEIVLLPVAPLLYSCHGMFSKRYYILIVYSK